MIKLAVISTDEASEERMLNSLRREKDFMVHGFVILQNVAHDVEKGLAFMNKTVGSPPDIIIVDEKILHEAAALSLPPMLEYTKKCTFTRAIIIGDRFHEHNLIVMMKEGARGFLQREHLDADLIKCIRVVARGEIWLNTNMIGRVFDELFRRDCEQKHLLKSPNSHQLAKMKDVSRREMEVMALISESMTTEEIADKLFISHKTVKTHIRNIFEKTGIRNRVEAALLYIRYKHETEEQQ
jgi:two-component system response regulator DegU